MFIRRRKNKSGTTSVVVVDKSSGKFRELKTIGVAGDGAGIEVLERKAREWMEHYTGQMSLDFNDTERARSEYRNMLSNVDRTLLNMPQTILNRIYDSIGFNSIDDFVQRFSLTDFVVVADSGLMSAKNIALLEALGIALND